MNVSGSFLDLLNADTVSCNSDGLVVPTTQTVVPRHSTVDYNSSAPPSVQSPVGDGDMDMTDMSLYQDIDWNDPELRRLMQEALGVGMGGQDATLGKYNAAPAFTPMIPVFPSTTPHSASSPILVQPPVPDPAHRLSEDVAPAAPGEDTLQLRELNNSSWANRNPSRSTLPVRHVSNKEKEAPTETEKLRTKIRQEQKKQAEQALAEDIMRFVERYEAGLADIAANHSVTPEKVARLVTGLTVYKKTRNPTLINALVFAKSQEVNANLSPGSKYTVGQLRDMIAADPKFRNLTEEDEASYKAKLQAHRDQKALSVRATNAAATRDVHNTLRAVYRELHGLAVRTGIYACLFVTRGHTYDTHDAVWFGTDNSMDFFEDVLELEPDDVVKKFELWACAQNKNLAQRESLDSMQRECTRFIRSSWSCLVGMGARINFASFETKIKLKHGIDIKGWPDVVPFKSPTNINSVDQIRALRDAFRTQKCFFYKMPAGELQEFRQSITQRRSAGETIGTTRKKRSDAGGKHKRKNTTDNGCSRKKSKAAPKKTPKSKEIIEDTDDEESGGAKGIAGDEGPHVAAVGNDGAETTAFMNDAADGAGMDQST